MTRILLLAPTTAALAACTPADDGDVRAGRAATPFGPSAAEVLAAEKYEYDYCVEVARRYPDDTRCASAPVQVHDIACKPAEGPFATCSYRVSFADGTNLPAPSQFYEKVGDRWELRSVIRVEGVPQ